MPRTKPAYAPELRQRIVDLARAGRTPGRESAQVDDDHRTRSHGSSCTRPGQARLPCPRPESALDG